MSTGVAFRRGILAAMGAAPVQRLIPRRVRGRGAILCLHSISETRAGARFAPMQSCRLAPALLNELLEELNRAGRPIVPLARVPALLEADPEAPFVCLTFDDGYRDNWEVAWPILRRWNAPFTLFVTSGFVEGSLPMCWSVLERIIGRNDAFALDAGSGTRHWRTVTQAEKHLAFQAVGEMFNSADRRRMDAMMADIKQRYGAAVCDEARDDAMDWDRLRELAADPLAGIGAHTVSHPMLGHLGRDEARREIAEAKATIERELGRTVRHFAYPFGDAAAIGAHGIELVREAGFALAVTTRRDVLRREDAQHPLALPRIALNGLYASLPAIRAQMSGVPSALQHLFSAARS